MPIISASAARQSLPAQLDRVEAGEQVAITRHGRVVAVLIRPDLLTAQRASDAWSQADEVGALIQRARTEPLRGPAISVARAEELVTEVRKSRSA